MAFFIADQVLETFTTTGTGDITPLGAKLTYVAFSARYGTNDEFYYKARGPIADAQWEFGYGRWTGTVIERVQVIESSDGDGVAVDWLAGTKDIFVPMSQAASNNPIGYGDGSLGDWTSASTTLAAGPAYYRHGTPDSGARITTAGRQLFFDGILDLRSAQAGAIRVLANDGSSAGLSFAGAGGAAPSDSYLGGGGAGSDGANGDAFGGQSSSAPSGVTGTGGDAGGGGGAGGISMFGSGGEGSPGGFAGSGGTVNGGATTTQRPHRHFQPLHWTSTVGTPLKGSAGGRGGGSAGGDGSNSGGGGGGGGSGVGELHIYARVVVLDESMTPGVIAARGGAGGQGGTPFMGNIGGGGGGGGGAGGTVYIFCDYIVGSCSDAVDVSGGDGGQGGNGMGAPGDGGGGGASGAGGKLIIVSGGRWRVFTGAASQAGSPCSGPSGGSGASTPSLLALED